MASVLVGIELVVVCADLYDISNFGETLPGHVAISEVEDSGG